jgi:hypothetical protein
MTKTTSHTWTKSEINKVLELWSTHSLKDLCIEIGINYRQIQYITSEIRKAGYNLPRKHVVSSRRALIFECIKDFTDK